MFENNPAPVALFVYDRPRHAEETLRALMQNELAGDTLLYIFCDGPKPNATQTQRQNIEAVRKIIRDKRWCREVIIEESGSNKGLANSILDGISHVFQKHDSVIVLEDDLVTSPYFLGYLNQGLTFYRNFKSVFSISADRPPERAFNIPADYRYDVFVSLRPFSTGWATWKDRWETVDWSMNYLQNFTANPCQIQAFNRGGEDLFQMLLLQQQEKIDSWAIRFAYAHFKFHSIAILPVHSYVSHLGYDGSGTHVKGQAEIYRNDLSKACKDPRFLDILYEDNRIIDAFYSYYYPKKRPFWKKGVNRLFRILGRKAPFVLKKRVFQKK